MAYRERVLLLYRHALKQTLHWSFEREVFFKEASPGNPAGVPHALGCL